MAGAETRTGTSDFQRSDQELVHERGSRKKRQYRSLLIVFVVICVLLAAIIAAVVLLHTFEEDSSQAEPLTGSSFTLDEILSGQFSAADFNGTWVTGDEFIYRDANGSVVKYNVLSGEVKLLVPENIMDKLQVLRYLPSPDGKYMLLIHHIQKVFRHSFIALYTIYNIDSGELIPLDPATSTLRDDQSNENVHLPLQYATWAPVGNAIAFVFQNDIFYRQYTTGHTYRVTVTGSYNTVYNGVPDWVYEEEILSSAHAMWFSEDGNMLAFGTFNDTEVNIMQYSYYGKLHSEKTQYPFPIEIHYPKPGRANPTVEIFMVSLTGIVANRMNMKRALPPPELDPKDHYFTAASWVDNRDLSIIWMNRHQNTSILTVCTAQEGLCKELLVVRESQGWTDMYTSPLFSKDKSQYLLILPVEQGVADKFKHVTVVTRSDGKITALTSGRFVVTGIVAWDEGNDHIYFTGSREGKPAQRHLYRINYPSSSATSNFTCLTCDMKNTAKEPCTYNKVQFSKDHTHYILTCNGPRIPEVTVRNIQGKKLKVWENNTILRERLSRKALPLIKNLQVELKGGYKAHVRMYLPPGFSSDKKYPLFISVYGGPDSQMVRDEWKIGWSDYLITKRKVIHATIDGRGSGMQGNKMLFELYYRLGSVEVEDQISVTKYLQDKFPFIDRTRTGIWGWSYGGYVTAMVMATDTENVFHCGVSVAPVTNWLYYDTVYTERYMGLPAHTDNFVGYNISDVTWQVENFKTKLYYLIHGTGDDNVHYQQSMMLSKALEKADVLFRQQSYPDEDHSMSGMKKHLYHSIENFLGECFNFDS